ncbi:hypothetical protein HYPSUDRAFT_215859 [Hypholoma sublateritium FD-334 SS-4]|uniref:Uncharacterized protein n=1 Tax=Hypholoma sublateritium (strain FD-334 SS-4) TaxID=945553 RepID=A0A0D2NTS9_HYPSF|nr:hypothetical protein HYPSUDRAFT_215859 [Hypholoma sublateritium FD-334 SS-4]
MEHKAEDCGAFPATPISPPTRAATQSRNGQIQTASTSPYTGYLWARPFSSGAGADVTNACCSRVFGLLRGALLLGPCTSVSGGPRIFRTADPSKGVHLRERDHSRGPAVRTSRSVHNKDWKHLAPGQVHVIISNAEKAKFTTHATHQLQREWNAGATPPTTLQEHGQLDSGEDRVFEPYGWRTTKPSRDELAVHLATLRIWEARLRKFADCALYL